MKKLLSILMVVSMLFAFVGCGQENVAVENVVEQTEEQTEEQVVNIYTDRHYDTDQVLYDTFTEETGIKVNVVKALLNPLIF